ncbi:cobalt-precorrin-5B (C(1))-methyltransferase CbiD [Hydrogenimonas thermophila]|uniref:cobalt-precorrin-5B (C(1))-methyltransferase CbiD n=1 Tax=Hydrogenimonas thermophila TaxID=223786 RepID=UPI002936E767|nr:cobalt-precorrin-5B (C(1))-methyltransferase CbiD [Hydrogenimonas thermophila]WOE68963.1 cobalt-precorrin-5B (C(1))-methyltransferase CbiD [Hydrogenimonas thermophila]WOE71470.1 cobalt-precorrin-5B (C(1))-methyltransferase CbiD [Hydrogenimonas thermophila]
MSELKKGYTTGVHALLAFRSALGVFLATKETAVAKNQKIDNDDLDVTKGATIVVVISNQKNELKLNPTPHKPYRYKNLQIFAGEGVGVVTKDGLKPPKGYPAINPTPLEAIFKYYESFASSQEIYCSIGIEDGEKIAKDTANKKVGVVGGLSILGTTGWVKPISAEAYLDSIEAELSVIKQTYKKVVFTLGNSSKREALKVYSEEEIVEIGNFIYDGIKMAINLGLDVILYIGIAKAVKVAQGFKNTHNRFGSIDFKELQEWAREKWNVDLSGVVTVKALCEMVDEVKFKKMVLSKSKKRLKEWFDKDIDIRIV